MSPPGKRKGALQAPILKLTTLPENNSSSAIAQQQLWHKRAVEHQQRLLIIRLLASIDRKLELLSARGPNSAVNRAAFAAPQPIRRATKTKTLKIKSLR
jgi:hypothetical protein